MTDVVVTRLDTSADAIAACEPLLSHAERRRAARFMFDRDRHRFIAARAQLRRLLAARLGQHPQSIELTYGMHGKPALAGRFAESDLRFNVSHCDEVAVFAFSRRSEVGVDVEAVRVMSDADAIAAQSFSPNENLEYRALNATQKPLGFFNCWTRKEAFVKAIGDGLRHSLASFDVSLTPGEPARILRIENTPGDRCGWRIASWTPLPGYVAAVVAAA